MRLAAGELDTEVQILGPTRAKNATYGTETITFAAIASGWAKVTPILPSKAENIEGDIDFARHPSRVWMRWRDDIKGTMRLSFDGQEHEIVSGPIKLGRRDGIELIVQRYSTKGQDA